MRSLRFLLVLIVLLTVFPVLASRVTANRIMVGLVRDLLVNKGSYPPEDDSYYITGFMRSLGWHNGEAVRWALGRSALLFGDNVIAMEALEPLSKECTKNPLLYEDILRSLSLTGDSQEVISFYRTCPPPLARESIKDIVALAYMQQAKASIDAGILDNVQSSLDAVVALRPDDLYANYHLWELAKQGKDQAMVLTYEKRLVDFVGTAIVPTDKRLVNFAAEIIPDLIREGLWERERIRGVISAFLVTAPGEEGVRNLVAKVAAFYPYESRWSFYLGELYQRRGEWAQAEAIYRQVLVRDSQAAEAYLHLGMICEAIPETCDLGQRRAWYEQYYQLSQDDLLGVKKLAQVLIEVGAMEDIEIAQELKGRLDDRQTVATLTGISPDEIHLGENLLPEGGFEQWWNDHEPVGWLVIDNATGSRWWNQGAFVTTRDEFSSYQGQSAADVFGFWGLQDAERSPAQYGYWFRESDGANIGWVSLLAGRAYLASLSYQTERGIGDSTAATMQLYTQTTEPLSYFIPLPPTDGAWHRMGVIVCVPSSRSVMVSPLIKSLSMGRVRFDDMLVKEVIIPVKQVCAAGND